MKLNLDYSNNTVRIGVELFDDGTKYEQGYSIKAGKDIHIDFATDFMLTYTAVRICMRKR